MAAQETIIIRGLSQNNLKHVSLDIPKGKIFAVAAALKQVVAKAPVEIGDVLLANVAGTGVDVVATKAAQ